MGYEAPGTAAKMTEAARAWLATLAAAELTRAQLPFEDEVARTSWYYAPSAQPGLPLGDTDPAARQAAHRLIASGLSEGGYATIAMIMGLEHALDGREGFPDDRYPGEGPDSRRRDPGMYFLGVFGTPGGERWGWRLGGHHVCLHYTISENRIVSITPLFFGANPATLPLVGSGTVRLLEREEALGRALVRSLDTTQLDQAVLSPVAPDDIVMGNRPQVVEGAMPLPPWEIVAGPQDEALVAMQRERRARYTERVGLTGERLASLAWTSDPRGISRGALDRGQRDALAAIVGQYLRRAPDEIAEQAEERLAGQDLHFAWAGETGEGPQYYRIQGPDLLIEYDNTQNRATHIHAVWREPAADFGADILAEHYARAHR